MYKYLGCSLIKNTFSEGMTETGSGQRKAKGHFTEREVSRGTYDKELGFEF